MHCPSCKFHDTGVKESRLAFSGVCVKRRRVCSRCGFRFTTHEIVVMRPLHVRKRSGVVKIFDREKLRRSLYLATRKCSVSDLSLDEAVDNIVLSVENLKEDGAIPTSSIGDFAMRALKKLDKVAYVRYASVYMNFKEIKDFSDFVLKEDLP